MHNYQLSVTLRKAALYLFAALIALLTALAVADWRAQTDPTVSATLGAPPVLRHDASGRLIISGLVEGSPLALAGAHNGDRISYDHPGTNLRYSFRVDETVGLTLYQQETVRHMALKPAPIASLDQTTESIVAALRWLASGISIVLALAITRLKGDDTAMRAFAWSLLFNAPMSVVNFLPAGALQDLSAVLMRPIEQVGGYACFMYFVLHYPDGIGYYRRPWVRRAFHSYIVAFVAVVFTSYALRNGFISGPVALSSFLRALLSCMVIGLILASMSVLWISWRSSRGITRNRIGWIGVCMGLMMGIYLCIVAYPAIGLRAPAILEGPVADAISFVALAGFAYALLRHRVFDFGFAVNRALVFTIISTFLLVIFSLTEFAVDKLLHFEGRQKESTLSMRSSRSASSCRSTASSIGSVTKSTTPFFITGMRRLNGCASLSRALSTLQSRWSCARSLPKHLASSPTQAALRCTPSKPKARLFCNTAHSPAHPLASTRTTTWRSPSATVWERSNWPVSARRFRANWRYR